MWLWNCTFQTLQCHLSSSHAAALTGAASDASKMRNIPRLLDFLMFEREGIKDGGIKARPGAWYLCVQSSGSAQKTQNDMTHVRLVLEKQKRTWPWNHRKKLKSFPGFLLLSEFERGALKGKDIGRCYLCQRMGPSWMTQIGGFYWTQL